MKKLLFIAIFMSVSFAYAGEIQFTMADLEAEVKNEAALFKTKVAEYNKLSKKVREKTEYPVPMALDDNNEYLLVSIIKHEYSNPRGASDKHSREEDNANNACRGKLLRQFVEKKAGSSKIVTVASITDIQMPYKNDKYNIDGGRLWQLENGNYQYVCTCSVALKNVISAQGGLIAKITN